MLTFPHTFPPDVPFIPDQRLWWLKVGHYSQTRECLRPEAFASAREVRKESPDQFARHQMPTGCEWIEVTDRAAFLANTTAYLAQSAAHLDDPQTRLLCLTIDAGIGKSTAMMQTQLLRGALRPGHLTIGVEFDRLPTKASDYLQGGWLAERLAEQLGECDSAIARMLLDRKIRTGEFTLLVDSLDQQTLGENPVAIATALGSFLKGVGSDVQSVVAGRPPAIQELWRHLFAKSGTWRFAQIDQFTSEQRRTYLSPERSSLLDRLDADIVAVPRMLETLKRIQPDADGWFPEIRTGADVYWISFKESLTEDIENRSNTHTFQNALFLFALLGFETLQQGFLNGIRGQQKTEAFLQDVAKRRLDQIKIQFAM